MDPKPVERTRNPGYPTRRDVLAGAASFVLVGLTGRGLVLAEAGESGDLPSGETVVAPIFEHGIGRGCIGCTVLVPAVFLSEEEGIQILGEELAKYGIELKPGRTLEEVRVPARIEKDVEVDKGDGRKESVKKVTEDMDHAAPLDLDGLDSKNRIAVEFVAQEDVVLFTQEDQPNSRKASGMYEFKDTAERIAAAAKKQGRTGVFLGVFYEPVVVKQSADFLAEEECRDLLRKQAQDFAAWLKEQGALPGGSETSSSSFP